MESIYFHLKYLSVIVHILVRPLLPWSSAQPTHLIHDREDHTAPPLTDCTEMSHIWFGRRYQSWGRHCTAVHCRHDSHNYSPIIH